MNAVNDSSTLNPPPAQEIPLGAAAEASEPREQLVARGRRQGEMRGLLSEMLQTVALTLVIFLGVRAVVQNFRVEGASMEPTLQPDQYLLINKAAYFHVEKTPFESLPLPVVRQGELAFPFGGPRRGDIVVFRAPLQPDKDFIKRVIGLPGDRVLIRGGRVSVNGKPLEESYVRFSATYNFPVSGQPYVVPQDSYFVLGDNRPNSSDSHLGWTVPAGNLIGRAWVSYWPPAELGIVAAASPLEP